MQVIVYEIRLNDPCLKVAHAIAELSLPWLLDAPGYLYSSALIWPIKRLEMPTQLQLDQIGAIKAEGREIEMRLILAGMVIQGQPIPEIDEVKQEWPFFCVRSFQRLIGNQYRLEAYVARLEDK